MPDPESKSVPGGERRACTRGEQPSELDRTRSRLVDTEARLRAILDTAVDAIITIDERGVIDSVNAAAERMFGYPAEELLGNNVSMLMPHAERARHDDYIRRYLETGERKIIGIGREVEGLHRDGSLLPLDLAVSEMHIDGRLQFTGILRDISQRKRAEMEARRRLDQLAHAGRLATLGELTTLVAHEVNQPLAAIVSYAEACLRMLRTEHPPVEKVQGALEQIVGQGQRAGEIIRHLRRMARKGETARDPVELDALVGGVLELFANELRAQQIEVELDLAPGLPRVRCDRIQIEQVLINLLRNAMEAVEHHPPGERVIRIGTRMLDGPAVELVVEDEGDGINPADAERIFETFFTTKPEGMGMGLAVSRTIVEAHGGRLWASARGERGAIFHVLLPPENGR
ncbi:MAG: PAS domain S-box protein [Gammaproteobacteria bacterium]|nr:PAS domain S-box protein [Gammaproteobacteria bacterium]